MSEQRHVRCPDCGGDMHQVRIVDKSGIHGATTGADTMLEYTHVDDKRKMLSGRYPRRGQILSVLCEKCGLIKLYGVEYPDKK